MPKAARIGDTRKCKGGNDEIETGARRTFIGCRPAARVGDKVRGGDHIKEGSPTVCIENQLASRITDATKRGGKIIRGCETVFIGTTMQADTLIAAARTGTAFCEECEKARRDAQA
jgi:uncharacterized Zn-binding protein involved in type VI secretion